MCDMDGNVGFSSSRANESSRTRRMTQEEEEE